jgi:hypothetical protein
MYLVALLAPRQTPNQASASKAHKPVLLHLSFIRRTWHAWYLVALVGAVAVAPPPFLRNASPLDQTFTPSP